ncbi:MAG: BlaI/MecI/CopY family transcriptional regulator, partial [Bacteroidota bacterium]
LMQIMFDKGFLDRTKTGKTHTYRPLVNQEETGKQMVDRLMSTVFEGSAMKLVMQALGNRKSSAEELRKIKSFIERLENEADDE